MLERLFRASFGDGVLVSEHHVQAPLAADVGVAGADALLARGDLGDAMRRDEARAASTVIEGVPARVLDERVRVAGARGTDVMRRALETAGAGHHGAP